MKKQDPIDTATIERATRFDATIFLGTGNYRTETFGSLAEARAAAPRLAAEVNNGRKAMIYAIAEGRSAFVPAAYNPTTKEGQTNMTATTLSGSQISQLTAVMTGGGFKRANSKEAAIKRFLATLTEKVGAAMAATYQADILGAANFQAARDWLTTAIEKAAAPEAAPKAATPAPTAKAAGKRTAALAIAAEAAPAPKAKPAKVEAAPKPTGKRAAVLAEAEAGTLPDAPDFSANTHKPHRKKLAEVVALVEAGDIAGLKAFHINPVSSSPKAIDRYRNLAVIALEARAKAKKAA